MVYPHARLVVTKLTIGRVVASLVLCRAWTSKYSKSN